LANEDESVWVVFNGEIYNFRELREQLLPRHRFRSQGDGEVILHLYEERGDAAVAALDGMFAFALWDTRRRRLLLARDRAGKKPLFYHDGPGLFAFASEPKALLAHPQVPGELDLAGLPLYLAHGYVPTPGTLYASIRSLPPGHWMAVTRDGVEGPSAYWSPRFQDGPALDEQEAEQRLRQALRAAVRRRLVADVPLGAFLSGGLDSSSVVALMAEAGPVKTFTISFAAHPAYDESRHARVVAERFGTQHTEFVVEPRALDLIDRLVFHHDAPFGDSSAVPTFLLAELTRSRVTVALNGDGGDEVLAGYLRFQGGVLSERLPLWAARALRAAARLLPEPADRKHPVRFLKRFAESAPEPLAERYFRWNTIWPGAVSEVLRPPLRPLASPERLLAGYRAGLDGEGSPLARLLGLNFRTYLLDDLLVKMDRMSMAHGLETRSPFLDTQLVELAGRLPDRMRLRRGRGKWLLRRAMRDLLPREILARGKAGFGVPLSAWFRTDLAAFVRDRLLQQSSPLYEYLEPAPVAALVSAHTAGRADLSAPLWSLLTLESWLRQRRR
jgi:asparagine synthase (glutamine-hydrolysing)